MIKKLLRTVDLRTALLNRDTQIVVQDSFSHSTKWEHHFEAVVRHEGRLYRVTYVRSATGPSVDPFRGASVVEAVEVEPFERTYTAYRPVQSLPDVRAEKSEREFPTDSVVGAERFPE